MLFELHKLPNQSLDDKELLKEYFEPVTELSQRMEKQIKFTLRRTLNTVRKNPKVIVTALRYEHRKDSKRYETQQHLMQLLKGFFFLFLFRIIEREEKSDLECAQRHKSTGFIPTGRPKKWKEKSLEILR